VLPVVLPLHFWLLNYMGYFLEHLRRQSGPLAHVKVIGAPEWMVQMAGLRTVRSALASAKSDWGRRRNAAAMATVALLLGMSRKTIERCLVEWRVARLRGFATRYVTGPSNERQWLLEESGLEECDCDESDALFWVSASDCVTCFKLRGRWFYPFVDPAARPLESARGHIRLPPGLTPRQVHKLRRAGYTWHSDSYGPPKPH
jgi:hypothetical protein